MRRHVSSSARAILVSWSVAVAVLLAFPHGASAQCNAAPSAPPTAAAHALDRSPSAWGISCENAPIGRVDGATAPSLDGRSLQLSLLGGVPFSNLHVYRTFPAEPGARLFTLNVAFRFTPTTLNNEGSPSVVQALEFTMNKWHQGKRFELALQWRNVGNGAGPGWRYWDPGAAGDRWVDLAIPDRLAPEAWHSLLLEGEILDGRVRYRRFVVDAQTHDLNLAVEPALTPGEPDRLAIGVQLDGNATQSPYGVFVDQVSFIRGAPLHGVDFSPYVDGQDPNFGTQISPAQIRDRLELIEPSTHWVRSFSSTHGMEHFPAIAREMGLAVAAGAWIGRDAAANQAEIANLIAAAQAGHVNIAIVGSEALLRQDATEQQLVSYISQVRQAVPAGVLVGTADTHDVLLLHPAALAAGNVVLPNIYPYWEGLSLPNAICAVNAAYDALVAAAGGRPIAVSESGWPSAGDAVGAAVPSPENAAAFFGQFVSWARARQVPYFYFEGLDEGWKARYEGPQGAHWGVWDKHGVLKDGMQPVLDGATVPVSCNGVPGGPGTPALDLTFVPPRGSDAFIEGRALHVPSATHKVVLYIQVNGGWWVKPFLASPLTVIQQDGTWQADIVTGGSDQNATNVAAFLIPDGYNPPLLTGVSVLPPELYQQSVANIAVSRSAISIAGRVTGPQGAPLASVSMSLHGSTAASTQTAASGNYSFFNLSSAGPHTVTPSAPDYAFAPASSTFAAIGERTTANFTGTQTADLTVSAAVSPRSAIIGAPFTQTIVVSNAGVGSASNAGATIVLPPGVSATSVTSTRGSCTGTTTISCVFGALARSAHAVVTVAAAAGVPGTFTLTTTVSAAEPDPDATNNATGVSVVIDPADGTVYPLLDPRFAYAVAAHIGESRLGEVGVINEHPGDSSAGIASRCSGTGEAARCALEFTYAFRRADDTSEFAGPYLSFGRTTITPVRADGTAAPAIAGDEFLDLLRPMRNARDASVSIDALLLVLKPLEPGVVLRITVELKDAAGHTASTSVVLDSSASMDAVTFTRPLTGFAGVDLRKATQLALLIDEMPGGLSNPAAAGFAIELVALADSDGPRLSAAQLRTLADKPLVAEIARREFEALLRLRDAATGASLDRTLFRDLIHWGATGWLLAALPAAVRMQWLTPDEARAAGLKILRFVDHDSRWCDAPAGCLGNSRGLFYRFGGIDPGGFLGPLTGTRKIDVGNVNAVEASTIDTALFQFGAAAFAAGFEAGSVIQSRVTRILGRTRWAEVVERGTGQLFLGWKPAMQTAGPFFATPAPFGGFWSSNDAAGTPLTIDYVTDEGLMAAILAAGSTSSSTGAGPWNAMIRQRGTESCASALVSFPGAWFTYTFFSAIYLNPAAGTDPSGVNWYANAQDVFGALHAISPAGTLVLPDAVELPNKVYKAQGLPACAVDPTATFTGTSTPYSAELAVGLGGAAATAAIAQLRGLLFSRPEVWDPLHGYADSYHQDLAHFPFAPVSPLRAEGRWVQQQAWPLNKGAGLLALLNYLDDGQVWRAATAHDVIRHGVGRVFSHQRGPLDGDGDGIDDILLQHPISHVGAWKMDVHGRPIGFLPIAPYDIGGWRVATRADLNHDGIGDIVLQHSSSWVGAWLMTATGEIGSFVEVVSADIGGWKVVGATDVNSDGNTDLILQHTTSVVGAWLMNASGKPGSFIWIADSSIGDWKVVATADLDSDGIGDIVLQHANSWVGAWLMNGVGQPASFLPLWLQETGGWRVVGAADVTNDRISDILLQHSTSWVGAWQMHGAGTIVRFVPLVLSDTGGWRVNGRP